MTANVQQIFSKVGIVGFCKLQAANTAVDGTGTLDTGSTVTAAGVATSGTATTTTGHLGTLFVADATNGGRVERIRLMAEGTNVATVLRLFINNGLTNATAMNNVLIAEIALPATTASNSALINSGVIELPTPSQVTAFDLTAFPIVLPIGYKLMACLGTAVASYWDATAFGGAY